MGQKRKARVLPLEAMAQALDRLLPVHSPSNGSARRFETSSFEASGPTPSFRRA